MMLRTRNPITDAWFTVDGVRDLEYAAETFEATRFEDIDEFYDIESDEVIPEADKSYLHLNPGETGRVRWLTWADADERTYMLLAASDVFVMNADGNTIDRVKIR